MECEWCRGVVLWVEGRCCPGEVTFIIPLSSSRRRGNQSCRAVKFRLYPFPEHSPLFWKILIHGNMGATCLCNGPADRDDVEEKCCVGTDLESIIGLFPISMKIGDGVKLQG